MHSRWKTRILDKLYQLLFMRPVNIILPKGMVSFTFDDFPATALVNGGRILEEYGWRGTFFTSMALLNTDTRVGRIASMGEVVECQARGHEIGNHTYGHIDCRNLDRHALIADIERNHRFLPNGATRNFSYPFGRVNETTLRLVSRSVSVGRGTAAGINGKATHLKLLKGTSIYSARGIKDALGYTYKNDAEKAWLIFYTHDVCPTPSEFGCTHEDFMEIVEAVRNSEQDVVTIEEGRRRIAEAHRKFRFRN